MQVEIPDEMQSAIANMLAVGIVTQQGRFDAATADPSVDQATLARWGAELAFTRELARKIRP